jgi:hypothetical protein
MDMRLLAVQALELGIVEYTSAMTVGKIAKKTYKPHLKECWCIPSKQNMVFITTVEDVLDVYQRPYDEKQPDIGIDEQPIQLFGEIWEPISMNEYHYKREDN